MGDLQLCSLSSAAIGVWVLCIWLFGLLVGALLIWFTSMPRIECVKQDRGEAVKP